MTSPTLTLKMLLLGTDAGASAALGSLATKASSLPAALAGPLSKMGSLIGGEVGELTGKFSEALDNMSDKAGGFGAKLTAGGAGVAGLGAAGTLAGSKDASSLAQLKQSITDTGGSYSDYQDEIEKTISKQENFGNSAVSTQTALANLTQATGDPSKAIANMGLVSDLAAAKHEDLATASQAVSKILEGTGSKTLKQYGITTTDMSLATQQLADKLKGQASASVDSWGGKLDVLKTKISDQVAQLGTKFGPALTVVGSGMAALGTVTEFVRGRQAAQAAAAAVATAATEAETAATEEATGAQTELDVAMDANPIGLIVLAIAALVAVIVIIATKTTWFQTIWSAAWGAIKDAAGAVWDFLKSAAQLVFDFYAAQWDIAKDVVLGVWTAIQTAVGAVWDAIQAAGKLVFDWYKIQWDLIVDIVTKLPARISAAATGMWDGIKDAFRSAIDWVIGAWNNLSFTIPGVDTHIPGVGKIGGFTLSTPDITPLALGGIVTRPTHALIGEAGDEAVIPLNKFKGGFGGSQDISFTVMLDSRVVASGLETISNTGAPLNIRIQTR